MGGGVFVKKWTFPERRVHYVQYQYFYFTFYLFGCAYAPNAPPCQATGLLGVLNDYALYKSTHTHSLTPS